MLNRAQVHNLLGQSVVGHTQRMLALRYMRRMTKALRYRRRRLSQRSGTHCAKLISAQVYSAHPYNSAQVHAAHAQSVIRYTLRIINQHSGNLLAR
jgi:hypothetical protein